MQCAADYQHQFYRCMHTIVYDRHLLNVSQATMYLLILAPRSQEQKVIVM